MSPELISIITAIISISFMLFIFVFLKRQLDSLKKPDNTNEQDLFKLMFENTQKQGADLQNALSERLKEVHGKMDFLQNAVESRLQSVREEIHTTSRTLTQRADENSKNLNVRLDKAAEVIGNVQKELGSMSEIGRGMKDLQDFLRSPKLRGNIGEEVLKDLLEQMLPSESYQLQYTFKSGERVDALLKVSEGYVSVDSKFPMENFNAMIQSDTQELRDSYKKEFVKNVRKHVDDIAKKYILPAEGTLDFALMYIPSETIYYEIVVNTTELGKYAWNKRVLPVSPNVFYSYLKAIMIGLEGKKIETKAKEILTAIRGLKDDSNKFADTLRILNKHISNAQSASEETVKKFEKIGGKIDKLSEAGKDTIEEIEDVVDKTDNKKILSTNSLFDE